MNATEQRIANLDAANQVRIERAKLRLRIKAGEVTAGRVLADWPDCIQGCGVYTFLTYLPAVGRNSSQKAFSLIHKASAPGHKRLDQLTASQLERLTRVVREFEDGRHPAERGMA